MQLDHDWYQERAPQACLMNMVDDATSTVEAYLRDEETIWAAVHVLRQRIEKHGVPLALYTDWKNVYVREPTDKEQFAWQGAGDALDRLCQKLDIRHRTHPTPKGEWSAATARTRTG